MSFILLLFFSFIYFVAAPTSLNRGEVSMALDSTQTQRKILKSLQSNKAILQCLFFNYRRDG